jgi:hypothetical protein
VCHRDEPRWCTKNVGVRNDDVGVTDDDPTTSATVRDRLTAAGLSDERIEQHLAAGRVRVDGELVTDPEVAAPAGTRIVIW